jgi:hypothetical protein
VLVKLWNQLLGGASALVPLPKKKTTASRWWEVQDHIVKEERSKEIPWIIGDRDIRVEDKGTCLEITSRLQEEPLLKDEHYRISKQEGALTFTPLLADRSLWVNLPTPHWLLPGARCQWDVLSPVWIQMAQIGHPPLAEWPLKMWRPTWSSSNPLQGDICYMTDITMQKVSFKSWAPWQVCTPVILHNVTERPLLICSFLLPHPVLDLYLDAEGQLRTSVFELVYNENSVDMALHTHTTTMAEGVISLGMRSHSAHSLPLSSLFTLVQSDYARYTAFIGKN